MSDTILMFGIGALLYIVCSVLFGFSVIPKLRGQKQTKEEKVVDKKPKVVKEKTEDDYSILRKKIIDILDYKNTEWKKGKVFSGSLLYSVYIHHDNKPTIELEAQMTDYTVSITFSGHTHHSFDKELALKIKQYASHFSKDEIKNLNNIL